MLNLAIPVPSIPGKQDIEIEMTIHGERHKIHYRVELFYWKDSNIDSTDRVDSVRNLLSDYNEGWEIYDIGLPTDEYVPLTFINKEDWAKQHYLLRKAL